MQKNNKLNWTIDQLWSGCILKSIAHAIMIVHHPLLAYENSWDNINYCIQDGEGMRGTVTFYNNYCIGAFRNEKCDRFNLNKIMSAYKFFESTSNEIIQLAQKETLQYLLLDINGDTVPVITTAFWGKDKELFSADSFYDFLEYGGELLETQVMDFDSAIDDLIDYYEMEPKQVQLLLQIYTRKMENPNSTIILSKKEIDMIGTDDLEGLEESLISFKEMNIDWEMNP